MGKLLLFDCDGTLLHTYDLIAETFRQTFELCLPNQTYTEKDIRSYFGPTINDTFRFLSNSEEKYEELMSTYRKINLELHPSYIHAYPNVKSTLSFLKSRGYDIAIVSNKMKHVIRYGLELTGLSDLIECIIGSDTVDVPKPDPMGIRMAMKHYNMNQAMMIGDSIIDLQAAKRAKIPFVGVTWAHVTKQEFQDEGADYVIDDMVELLGILGE